LFPIQAPGSIRGRGHTAYLPDKKLDTELIQQIAHFLFLVKMLLKINILYGAAMTYVEKCKRFLE
jgi:hypothetical protein